MFKNTDAERHRNLLFLKECSILLELRNIKKDYPAGDGTVHALKGISLGFRESEFVSILGQSGCGKTTMLNIVGGLDGYTEGDLIINGRSTKDFNDRDWDSYRNHSVGFVFQSYNLIPHQSVLQNVELALSLSGVSKTERRRRAIAALEEVGLGNQLKKRPAEMSGGQMQRVAIARALVNNPDIILADEPTGALDSETSIQVMDILKEVSKKRLVIMVTHNSELAEQYSTRIIRMLDGVITSDSAPLSVEEQKMLDSKRAEESQIKKRKRERKPSMSFSTSFVLSLKNLFTKKGRTILTSFAGSIGIIGIALIFAVSQGMTTYINTVQEDTLSSYPLTLEAQHMDMGTLLDTFMGQAMSNGEHENDAVYQKAMFYNLVNSLNSMESTENDLRSFKAYLDAARQNENDETGLRDAVTGVMYTYSNDFLVYTKNIDGNIIRSDSQELMMELLVEYFGMDLSSMFQMSESYGMSAASMSPMAILWQEMLSGNDGRLVNDLLLKQYDVIYGSWPTEYNEIVIVVDEKNEIDDMTLYALGLNSKEDIDALARAAFDKGTIEVETKKWSYEEICGMDFRTILSSDCYVYDEKSGTYVDLRDSEAGLKYLYDNGLSLKVSGIVRPNEDAVAGMLVGTIGYTSELTKYIIENSKDAPAINAQLADPSTDVFTGLPFRENTGNLSDEMKAEEFKAYVGNLSVEGKADAYVKIMSIPPKEMVENTVNSTVSTTPIEQIKEIILSALSTQMSVSESDMISYIDSMKDEELIKLFGDMVEAQFRMKYAEQVQAKMEMLEAAQLSMMLDAAIPTFTTEMCAEYYGEILVFSDSSYDANLLKLGYVDLDKPSSINLYASTFEDKDVIEAAIAEYNASVDEFEEIAYTDYVGLLMSSVTTIINAITYVLIAFVAVSLIVSSIMIGVITLISVQERTKEIGILRAIGASKKNVSSMFNAETVIIGFTSGTLGVLITYLLCIPINLILHHLTGISNLSAYLPVSVAVILVVISVMLTLVAGIIPSRSAAKKDPVVALRTE